VAAFTAVVAGAALLASTDVRSKAEPRADAPPTTLRPVAAPRTI